MDMKEAYRIVFDDLTNCGLFCGKYDARYGSEEFMYGIESVMEVIAYKVSEEVGNTFSDMFTNNIIASEEKVEVVE